MDLSKLKLNKEILNVVFRDARPEAVGSYKEINEQIPYKKVFLKPHAFERFLERTNLTKEDVTNFDVSRHIVSNRPRTHFIQFKNETDKKKITDKHIIVRIRFGQIPFELVLIDKEDHYDLKTIYFDWNDSSYIPVMNAIFEREKANKEFNQMLIDNFFGSQKAKDEFDKLEVKAKEEKIKEISKTKINLISYHNFKDILENKKREFKNIRVDREVKDEFNIRREVKKDVVVVSASDFKEDINWEPEFSDIDLDIESDFEDEE